MYIISWHLAKVSLIKGLTFRDICAIIVILLAKYELYSVFHLFVLYCDDSNVCYYINRVTLTPCNIFEKYTTDPLQRKWQADWHVWSNTEKKVKHDVLIHRYMLMNICFRIDPRIDVYQHNAHVIMRHEN